MPLAIALPLLTLGVPADFSFATASPVSLTIAVRKPCRALFPWLAFLIEEKLSALERVCTSRSNGAIAEQIDFTYAAGVTFEDPLDPQPATTSAVSAQANAERLLIGATLPASGDPRGRRDRAVGRPRIVGAEHPRAGHEQVRAGAHHLRRGELVDPAVDLERDRVRERAAHPLELAERARDQLLGAPAR